MVPAEFVLRAVPVQMLLAHAVIDAGVTAVDKGEERFGSLCVDVLSGCLVEASVLLLRVADFKVTTGELSTQAAI